MMVKPPNIKILWDSRNYTIILDNVTRYIWLYSENKPIAYFDIGEKRIVRYSTDLSGRNQTHIGLFKKRWEK